MLGLVKVSSEIIFFSLLQAHRNFYRLYIYSNLCWFIDNGVTTETGRNISTFIVEIDELLLFLFS